MPGYPGYGAEMNVNPERVALVGAPVHPTERNPFRVRASFCFPTQGCPTKVGQAPRLNTHSAIRNPQSAFARAFTLIELMVVIAIIAILATLVLQVAGGLISNAREAATKATISKIQAILNTRQQAFERLTMRKGYLTGSSEYQSEAVTAANLGNPNLQPILAMKDLQRKFFPQTWAETTPYVPPFQPNIVANRDATNPEILYDSLTQSNMLGDTVVGTDTFSTAEVAYRTTANNTTLGRFIDAWGNPIRFYRWPTRLFRSNGMNGGSLQAILPADVTNVQQFFTTLPVFTGNLINDLARDPDDPLQACLSVPNFEQNYHTPVTFHVFLVVSAGPDGLLGMAEPDDPTSYINRLGLVTDTTALNDNIISLNIRAGGK